MVQRVSAILDSNDFTPEKVKKSSPSELLVAILMWSKAIIKYHNLLKTVNPKRIEVNEMKEEEV